MKTKIIIALLFTFYCVNISAQSSARVTDEPQLMNVIDLDDFLAPASGLQRSSNQSAVTLLNIQNVLDLVYNVQPSTYYFEGVEKTFGEKPRNLFTDINSLNNLNNGVTLKNNIEIINIRLTNSNQLNSNIDLELFSSFKNLKYIYILTSFETTEEAISNMIVGSNQKYSVFYNIETGDTN